MGCVLSEPYLIAHKVRGEAAFDVAIRMDCPECMDAGGCNYGCAECDNLGYWWIIPTSGHRAYPYEYAELGVLTDGWIHGIRTIPDSLSDHYPPKSESKSPKRSLLAELGLAKPQGHPAIVGKINRRI